MAKYVSGRQKNLKVGIASYSENLTSLEVIGKVGIGTTNAISNLHVVGNAYFTGFVTAGHFIGNGSGLTGITATGSGVEIRDSGTIVGAASTIDFGDNLTVSPISAGVVTVTAIFTGIVTYAANAGIATYADTAGIATYASSAGIATYATNAGIATYATNAGIATYASTAGIATYASNAGIATYASNAGIATYASSAGIATYATNAGIATYATNAGIATYADTAGIATGLTTTSNINTSGIITASKFFGDGSFLTNLIAPTSGIGINSDGVSVGYAATILNFSSGILVTPISSGIATVSVTYAANAGIATYATNAGIATYASNAGIATYATSAGIATYATNAGIATYASNAGIATYASNAGIATYASTAGYATTAFNLNGTAEGDLRVSYASTAGYATTAFNLNGVVESNLNVAYASTAGYATTAFNLNGVVESNLNVAYSQTAGIATYATSSGIATYATSSGIATYAISAGIATYASSAGIATYATNAGIATALQNSRTFEITGDIIASPISFNGTGNVSLAATIQPNSVGLGTDTTGDYVQSITGTSNQITVTSGTGEGSTPTLSIPNQFTVPQDIEVTRDLQVNRNLNVNGNITIGGTSATLFSQSLNIFDPDIVLGFRTDAFNNDVSNDNTANHGGVALASTEGNPLVQLFIAGIETNPATYKKIMWFKAGEFSGLGTDAWLVNYAVGIGSTQFPTGTRLAAGSVQFTERDLAVVRNINSSGIITGTLANNLTLNTSGTGLSGSTTYNNSGAVTFTVASDATNNNTSSTIVARDASGNFSAGTITANLTGTATTANNLADAASITTGTINSARLSGTYNIDISGNSATAGYAITAGIATYASTAGIATYADTAGIATYASTAGIATYASNAGIATYASNAGIATYASNAGIATYASNAGVSTSVIGGIGSITQLQVTGISTFTNGPVFIGSGTSTGTASQPLQVTGGAYISGSVGVGITNPTEKLWVDGNGYFTGILTANRVFSGQYGEFVGGSISGTNLVGAALSISGISTFTNGPVFIGSGTSTGTASQPLQVTGGAYVSGNLGIGTTNPTEKLWVDGNGYFTGILTANRIVSTQYGEFTGGGISGTNIVGTALSISGISTFTNGPVFIGSGTSTGTASQPLQVTGGAYISGSVGVGTTNPQYIFTVTDTGTPATTGLTNCLADFTTTANSYGQINLRNTSTGTNASSDIVLTADTGNDSSNFIDLGINNSGFSVGSWTINGANDGYLYTSDGNLSIGAINASVAKYISFFTGGTLISNERMRINATGVGIGTTNPSQPLHVQGNARVTGAIYDSTNSPGTSGQVLQSTQTGTLWVAPAAPANIPGLKIFDTSIDNVLYVQLTGTLDIVGVGTTVTQITTLPSSSPEYIIHSLHVTNISNGDAEITAGFVMNARKVPATISVSIGQSGGPGIHTFTVGSASSIRVGMAVTGTGNIGETTGIGSTAGFQFNTYVTSVDGNTITVSKPMSGHATGDLHFSPVSLVSSRLPVPVGSAVELLKQPMVLNALDSIVLQSTGAGSGIGSTSTAAVSQTANSNILTVTAGAAITNFLASGMLIQGTGSNTGIQTNTFVGVGYTPGALSIPMTRPATSTLASQSLSFAEVVVPQDGALQVTVVYQSSTDTSYQNGTGTVVGIVTLASQATSPVLGITSTVPLCYYGTGNTYPSTIQSIRVSNISDGSIYPGGDYPVWVGIGNSDTIFSWLAYNMVIPKNSSIELCEAPKRLGIGQSIFAYASTPYTIEIQIAAKQKTS